MADKPTLRALAIFASVAQQGPVTLNRLAEIHPDISRAAIWRALDNLRSAGWVRDRLGDHAWLITHKADDVLGNAHIPPRAVEEVMAKLPKPTKGAEIHIASFTEIGRCEIVESTDLDRIGEILRLIDDPMAFAALATAEEADMLRHLKRWMDRDADAEERAFIVSGALTKRLRAARISSQSLRTGGTTISHRSTDGSIAVIEVYTLSAD